MVGIDIVSVSRFNNVKKEDLLHWDKYFSHSEWEYCFKKPDSSQTMAGIFAAKEAVMKAIGGDSLQRFDTIEITHKKEGKPIVQVEGYSVDISISHDGGFAVAVAMVHT